MTEIKEGGTLRAVQGAGPDEVLNLQGLPVFSQACMKALSKEHKRSCEKKEEVSADDALADQLELKLEQKRLWLVIRSPAEDHPENIDVQSLCRTDNVMTAGLREGLGRRRSRI